MTDARTTLVLLAATALLSACGHPLPTSAPMVVSGHTGTIAVASTEATKLRAAADTSYHTINRILFTLNSRDPKSDISRINGIAGSARWPISSDTYRILDLINHYSLKTDGALDVTMAPIAELWGLGGDEVPPSPPAPELINAALQGVGQLNVKLADDGTIAFYSPLTRIDVGTMAIGYAVDLSVVNMRRQGITNVLLRLDNTTRSVGHSTFSTPWTAPLQDPWSATQYLGEVLLPRDAALAIVNLYEHSVTIGDKTYGHILDPHTGRPAEGTLLTAVIGPSATMANALAQALLVAGLEKAPELLQKFPRCDALVVPNVKPYEIWLTENFARHFHPNAEYASQLRAIAKPPPPNGDAGTEGDEQAP